MEAFTLKNNLLSPPRRARTQFALVEDIKAKWDDILAIMREITGR